MRDYAHGETKRRHRGRHAVDGASESKPPPCRPSAPPLRLPGAVGSPVNAAFVSFFVGTVALGLLAMALQTRPDVQAMKALPAWGWMGGLYGCVFVVAAAWGVSKADVIRLLVRDQDRRLHNGGRPPVLEAMTRKGE